MARAPQTEKTINWGGVLKGAAIVTAVVVAAAVGFLAFQAGAAALSSAAAGSSGTTLGAIGTSTLNGLSTAADWLIGQANWIGGLIKTQWTALPTTLGLSTSLNTAASSYLSIAGGTAGVSHAAGVIGATVATAAAIPAASHALHSTHFTDTTTVTAHSATMAQMHAMHDAHMAHHAAEHVERRHGQQWSGRVPQPSTAYTSHADYVRATSPKAASIPTPSDSFAKDIAAETAQLNQALGK